MTKASPSLLQVTDLSVAFKAPGGAENTVVNRISFSVDRGETLALVGESGSGKSVSALSVMQLLPYPSARHPSGSIVFDGQEIMGAPPETMQHIRGNDIAMVFQEPMTSLNPVHTITKQIGEVLALHKGLTGDEARTRILELLHLVGIHEPEKRLDSYPHQLSGGQRQRVMIAMALANEPALLIADEPTTALDVTVQAQVLALLKSLQQRLNMALLLITHDLSVVRKVADNVAVMTDGEIVETGVTEQIFTQPQHAYTRHLLAAEPKGRALDHDKAAAEIVTADSLKVYFPIKAGILRRTVDHVRAVDGISLAVQAGQTLGVVGESGSGKTTLGLALLRLISSQGHIRFQETDIQGLNSKDMRPLRRQMQVVFQDPYGSLSPRMTVRQIIEEGLSIHGIGDTADDREQLVREALDEVGLEPAFLDRYPHEFSGGQRQRIAIARAMVLKPSFVVLDEPTSALDMSVQAQIVDLLRDLQRRHNLAYLFISHDLKVVRALSDRVIVMRQGKVEEAGPVEQIFDAPQSAYTKALIAAAIDLEATESGVVAS